MGRGFTASNPLESGQEAVNPKIGVIIKWLSFS